MGIPHLLLLLSVVMVNLIVSIESTPLTFPPKVLSSDLAAIAKNFEKDISSMACLRRNTQYSNAEAMGEDDRFPDAYISWPNSITFRVRLMREKEWKWEQHYLKIEGQFQYRKFMRVTHSYDGLYYQAGKFYAKISDAEPMCPIHPDEEIYYVQPPMEEVTQFVSIKYFGLKESTERIKSLHKENPQLKEKVDTQYCNSPFPCSIKLVDTDMDVLEYTYWCESKVPLKKNVKVLIGDKHKVTDVVVRSELVFDHKVTFPALTVREDQDRGVITKNVFAVRNSIEGFDDN